MKNFIAFIGMVISGMWGGQRNKGVRRFGLPLIAFTSSQQDGFQCSDLAFLILIPVLCLGYGEHSHLMKLIGNDTVVRAAYAFLLSIPFMFNGLVRWTIALCCLVLAFQVKAGSLVSINNFDILIEDIVRYATLSVLVLFNLKRRKK